VNDKAVLQVLQRHDPACFEIFCLQIKGLDKWKDARGLAPAPWVASWNQ
jgi:hypothetical protein